ncbi:MAG: hypothetical protein AB9M60_10190 [Leptothrix sp. (in: b-proteobacteria)]
MSIPRWCHARTRRRVAAAALMMCLPMLASAWELDGRKSLTLHTRDQQHIEVGSVTFEPRGEGVIGFRLAMATERFTDHFLSMKEFKCLSGDNEIDCHVPYPYPQPGTVRVDGATADFAWLEHSLLFLFKLPREFGAKLWNGLYFELERTDRGLRGRPQAVDLNAISAPPDRPGVPPYTKAQRSDIAAGARWIESITIE